MENTDVHFDINITVAEGLILICATGNYALLKVNNLFKLSIDNAVLHNKRKILIDGTNIIGTIPLMDRFQYSEFLANYKAVHALTKVDSIAIVAQAQMTHKDRFGETVAVNRGVNVRVFTDMNEASTWLNQ